MIASPLFTPSSTELPDRTVTLLGPNGQPLSSTAYANRIGGELQNPRSTAWNLALERQVYGTLHPTACL